MRPTSTRFVHVHRNRPGTLREFDELFPSRCVNVSAQCLQTHGEMGHVVVDANTSSEADEMIDTLRAIKGTIRTRSPRR